MQKGYLEALVRSNSALLTPKIVYPLTFVVGMLLIFLAGYYPDNVFSHLYIFVSAIVSRSFTKSLGEALVVASVVGVTVDFYNIRRHRLSLQEMEKKFEEIGSNTTKKVAKDASDNGILSVYQSILSEPIVDAISKYALKAEATRPKYEITVTLEKEAGKVRIQQTVKYNIKNNNERELPHTVRFKLDKAVAGMPPYESHFVIFSCDGKTLLDAVEAVGQIEKQIDIPRDGEVEIVISTSELRDEYDFLYWSSLLPGDKMKMRVMTPKRDIEPVVDALHPDDPVELPSGTPDLIREWMLNGAVLPGQGFLLKWKVRP